jgi:hypothetical protein
MTLANKHLGDARLSDGPGPDLEQRVDIRVPSRSFANATDETRGLTAPRHLFAATTRHMWIETAVHLAQFLVQ